LETLALQHEALMSMHTALAAQHGALLVRHETVLAALEQLVGGDGGGNGSGGSGGSGVKVGSSPSPTTKSSAPEASADSGSKSPLLRRAESAPATNGHSAGNGKAAVVPSPRVGAIRPPSQPSASHPLYKSSTSPTRGPQKRGGASMTGGGRNAGGGNAGALAPNNHSAAADHGLRVVVRKRPAAEDEVDCVEVLAGGGVLVHEDKVRLNK
jgi:hypothetical protein